MRVDFVEAVRLIGAVEYALQQCRQTTSEIVETVLARPEYRNAYRTAPAPQTGKPQFATSTFVYVWTRCL